MSEKELIILLKNGDEKAFTTLYRLYWSKIPKTFIDRYKYQLNLVRENKRYLAKLIFNKQDYKNINDI
jgi:RNA polymerase sigma-70 factor (ECF subfamily)